MRHGGHLVHYGDRFREALDLLISFAVVSIAFSIKYLHIGARDLALASSIAVGIGFLLHEMAHRLVAKALGYISRYRAWYLGLALALVIAIASRGSFVFAAPGAVEVAIPWPALRAEALISLAGPLANLAIAMVCLALGLAPLTPVMKHYVDVVGGVNALLGFFNLLPIPPLDGFRVFRNNIIRWLVTFATSIALVLAYHL